MIGVGHGYYVYQITLDLPEPFTLTTGKYWVAPKVNNSFFGAFWEMTSTGSSYSNVYKVDETGWTATDYQAVFFISGECSTLSNDDFPKSEITFSPNPVKDIVKFSSTLEIKSVEIYNMLGQLIKKEHPTNGEINMTDFKCGIYLFKIQSAMGLLQTYKIIKE